MLDRQADGLDDGAALQPAALERLHRRLARDDNTLPVPVRQNIANIGVFVMNETFALMTNPRPSHLVPLININRELAAGLRGKA